MSNPRPNSEMQPEAPAPRARADWGQWGRRATATAQGIVVVATFVLGTIAALQTHEGDAQLADLGRAAFITFYCGGIRAFLSLYPAGRDRLPWSLLALLGAPAGGWLFMHPDLYRQIFPDPFVGIPRGPPHGPPSGSRPYCSSVWPSRTSSRGEVSQSRKPGADLHRRRRYLRAWFDSPPSYVYS